MSSADVQVRFEADINDLKKGLNSVQAEMRRLGARSKQTSDQIVASNKKATQSFDSMGKAVRVLGTAFAVLKIGAATIAGFTRIASEVQKVNFQLKAVTASTAEYEKAQKLAYAVAQQTGVALADTATVLTRFTFALKESGVGIEYAAVVADTLNKALLVTGATGAEATSVLTQVSQALTKGQLNGDEFRSLAENAGYFIDVLAKSMGVAKSELKGLAAQGKITTADVVKAARDGQAELTAMAEKSALPLDRVIEQIRNTFINAVTTNEAFSASLTALGGFLQDVAYIALQFFNLFANMNFGSFKGEVVATSGALAFFGSVIKNVIIIVSSLASLMVNGLAAAWVVVSNAIDYQAIQIEKYIGFIKLLMKAYGQLGQSIKNAFDPDATARSWSGINAEFERGVANLTASASAKVAASDAKMKDALEGIALNISDTLGQAVALSLGEGFDTGVADAQKAWLKSIFDGLQDFDSKASPAISAAGQKLGEKYAEALADALRDFKSLSIQVEIDPASIGYDALLKAKQEDLKLEQQIADIRFKYKGIDTTALEQILKENLALERQLEINKELSKYNEQIRDMGKTLADEQEVYAARLEGATVKQIEALRGQLDIENEMIKVREKFPKLTEEQLANYEKILQALEALKTKNKELDESIQKQRDLVEAWSSILGDAFVAIVDGSMSAKDALRQLLGQMIALIAKALILKAITGGSFGSIFNDLLTGGSGVGLSGSSNPNTSPSINIYNQSGGGVTSRTDSNGNTEIIIGQLATSISRGGNQFDKMLRKTYGLSRVGV